MNIGTNDPITRVAVVMAAIENARARVQQTVDRDCYIFERDEVAFEEFQKIIAAKDAFDRAVKP